MAEQLGAAYLQPPGWERETLSVTGNISRMACDAVVNAASITLFAAVGWLQVDTDLSFWSGSTRGMLYRYYYLMLCLFTVTRKMTSSD